MRNISPNRRSIDKLVPTAGNPFKSRVSNQITQKNTRNLNNLTQDHKVTNVSSNINVSMEPKPISSSKLGEGFLNQLKNPMKLKKVEVNTEKKEKTDDNKIPAQYRNLRVPSLLDISSALAKLKKTESFSKLI